MVYERPVRNNLLRGLHKQITNFHDSRSTALPCWESTVSPWSSQRITWSAGGLEQSAAELKVDELPGLVVQALAHALDYLREFNLEAVLQQSCAFRPFSQAHEIALSPNALR